MKRMMLGLAMSLALAGAAFGGELSEADKKWAAAVEKMIEKGTERISTPDSSRADLAVELAKKKNRTASIQKSEKGYVVTFGTASTSQAVAKSDK